jgi:hypothetical protein
MLIDAADHRERIAAVRAHPDAWIADTGDLGLVLPETKLVRERLWPPVGLQPTTPPAEISDKAVQRGEEIAFVLTISRRSRRVDRVSARHGEAACRAVAGLHRAVRVPGRPPVHRGADAPHRTVAVQHGCPLGWRIDRGVVKKLKYPAQSIMVASG